MKTKLLLLFTCIIYVSIYGQHFEIDFENHMITDNADEVWAVFPADLDGDGDIDVVGASAGDDTIAWYDNVNGDGTVWEEHELTTTAVGVSSLCATDIDGDGDMDLISGSFGDDTIAWWENDGSGDFTEHEITTSADGVASVFCADINGDGDMDVISGSFLDNTVAWWENDGSGNFVEHEIITNAIGANTVCAEDLNGDTFVDVISDQRMMEK